MPSLALIGFVFFGLFSPGPNVILVTASGARFGMMRTVPHIAGIVVGVGIIAGVTGLGIGALLSAVPVLKFGLTLISVAWILYLAFRLWFAVPPQQDNEARPFRFVEAILFQWINPKIWAVAISASAYTAELTTLQQAVMLGGTFSLVNTFVCCFWTFAGSLLSVLLLKPAAWRIFVRGMAIALVGFSLLLFV